MSRSTTALKRLGVPSLAAVTLVAGLPLFLGTASAGHIAGLTLTPETTNEAAGVCVPYTAQLAFSANQTPRVEDIDVIVTENTSATTLDVDFCTAPTNGVTPASPAKNVDGGAAGTTDQAEFTTDATGKVTFGIVANELNAAGVTLRAFYEVDGSPNDNDRFDAGEFTDTSTATFVAGGPAGSNANQDAVRDVEVVNVGEPVSATATATLLADDADTANAIETETRTYRVAVRDGSNNRLAGVAVTFSVDSTDNTADRGPAAFAVSNNDGIAVGTITFPVRAGTADTTDTVQFFVNQSNGATASRDAVTTTGGEPFDNLVVTVRDSANQQNRTVTLTPLADTDNPNNATNPAVNSARDGNRSFRAIVDAADGQPATAGTQLAFAVTGGSGDETVVPAEPATTDFVAATGTDSNDSFVDVVLNDPTPIVGQVLTVTVTVRGTTTTATSTLTFRNAPADANTITLAPKTVTVAPNTAQQLTATVLDVDGKPVAGVVVDFSETGAGAFRNGSSFSSSTTNAAGQATVETLSLPGETGTQTVTATIDGFQTAATAGGTNAPQCSATGANRVDPQGNALNATTNTGAAGDCDDTAVVTYGTVASPSATPTATATPTGAPNCTPAATVNIQDTTIIATGAGRLSVDAPANSIIELEAYTRPSTTYRVVRRAEINAAGDDAQFLITPPANTRLRARVVGCPTYGESKVMNVRTALSLFAKRNGVRNYTFSGDSLPARPGGLIISLYRVTASGSQVLTSQVRANATNGEWSLTRQFTGEGRFGFVVRTGQDLQNAPGTSNVRPTLIF